MTGRSGSPRHPRLGSRSRRWWRQFARAFLADDLDGMVALITQNAWFRMPPAHHEYHGPELIGAFLAAVRGTFGPVEPSDRHPCERGARVRDLLRRPPSGSVQQSGLLVLSLAGARVTELTWFLGSGYLERFDLPGAPFVDVPVLKAA